MPDVDDGAPAISPAGMTGRAVVLPGGRYQVWTAGPPDAPTVLLIHGLGWDARRTWRGTMRRLAELGHRVIAPDLLGSGGSDLLAAPRPLEATAADLAALLEVEGVESCAVVGFSMGGTIAMALAARPHSPVRCAVFACCTTGPDPAAAAATEAMLTRANARGPRRFAREQADAIWHPAFAARHPEVVADFVAWRAAMDQASLANSFRSLARCDLSSSLATIRQPALVIAADADPFVAVGRAQLIADVLPNGRFAVVERSGHMAPIEQPERFDGLVTEFLSEACAAADVG